MSDREMWQAFVRAHPVAAPVLLALVCIGYSHVVDGLVTFAVKLWKLARGR